MGENTDLDLEGLALEAAQEAAGQSAVEEVRLVRGLDSYDRPAYHFSFLMDLARSPVRPGLILIQLFQNLTEKLLARGDDHFPVIQILNREDWDKRAGARSL